jgi:hypothetical protein
VPSFYNKRVEKAVKQTVEKWLRFLILFHLKANAPYCLYAVLAPGLPELAPQMAYVGF